MTLLGSVYAVGYLGPHFTSKRHLGVHYALLNLMALSFVLVYTADHALIFLRGWETAAPAAWLLVRLIRSLSYAGCSTCLVLRAEIFEPRFTRIRPARSRELSWKLSQPTVCRA